MGDKSAENGYCPTHRVAFKDGKCPWCYVKEPPAVFGEGELTQKDKEFLTWLRIRH